jgi:hypothetical protein
MLHKTRCKFYVSAQNISSTQPSDLYQHHLNATIKLNAAYSPDPSTENYSFWNATPSGSATINLYGEEQIKPYAPGSFWYIDIWEDAEGDWKITKLDTHEYNINVELTDGSAWQGDKIELAITNKNAWEIFEKGKKYKAEFIPAVKS